MRYVTFVDENCSSKAPEYQEAGSRSLLHDNAPFHMCTAVRRFTVRLSFVSKIKNFIKRDKF